MSRPVELPPGVGMPRDPLEGIIMYTTNPPKAAGMRGDEPVTILYPPPANGISPSPPEPEEDCPDLSSSSSSDDDDDGELGFEDIGVDTVVKRWRDLARDEEGFKCEMEMFETQGVGLFLLGMDACLPPVWINTLVDVGLFDSADQIANRIEMDDGYLMLVEAVKCIFQRLSRLLYPPESWNLTLVLNLIQTIERKAILGDRVEHKRALQIAMQHPIFSEEWQDLQGDKRVQKYIKEQAGGNSTPILCCLLFFYKLVHDNVTYYSLHGSMKTHKNIRQLVKRYPDEDVKTLREQGDVFFKKKDYVTAAECYSAAMKQGFDNHSLYGNRAQCFIYLGEYRKAYSDCRRSLFLDSTYFKGYYRAAEACLKLNRLSEALQMNEDARRHLSEHYNDKTFHHSVWQQCKKIQEAQKVMKEREQQLKTLDKDLASRKNHLNSGNARKDSSDLSDDSLPSDLKLNLSGLESNSNNNSKDKPSPRTDADADAFRLQPLHPPRAQELSDLDKVGLYLKDGVEAVKLENYVRASAKYQSAMSLLASSSNLRNELNADEQLAIRIAFAITSTAQEGIKSCFLEGLELLRSMYRFHFHHRFPFLMYVLGRALEIQYRFGEALEVADMSVTKSMKKNWQDLCWPQTDQVISLSQIDIFTTKIQELVERCRHPPTPDAVCFDHLEQDEDSKNIYVNSPVYTGRVEMCCYNKCRLVFHISCWKEHKTTYSSGKVAEKEILEKPCPTPDCGSFINQIVIQKPSDKKEGKNFHSTKKPERTPKSKSSKMAASNPLKIARREERKAYKRQKKAEARQLDKASPIGSPLKLVNHILNHADFPENGTDNEELMASVNSANPMVLLHKEEDDLKYNSFQSQARQKKKEKKSKKEKTTINLPVEFNFAEDEDREACRWREQDAVEVGGAIPTADNKHPRWTSPMPPVSAAEEFGDIAINTAPAAETRKTSAEGKKGSGSEARKTGGDAKKGGGDARKSSLARGDARSLVKEDQSFSMALTSQPAKGAIRSQKEEVILHALASFFLDTLSTQGPQHIDGPMLKELFSLVPEESNFLIQRRGGYRSFFQNNKDFVVVKNYVGASRDVGLVRRLAINYSDGLSNFHPPPFLESENVNKPASVSGNSSNSAVVTKASSTNPRSVSQLDTFSSFSQESFSSASIRDSLSKDSLSSLTKDSLSALFQDSLSGIAKDSFRGLTRDSLNREVLNVRDSLMGLVKNGLGGSCSEDSRNHSWAQMTLPTVVDGLNPQATIFTPRTPTSSFSQLQSAESDYGYDLGADDPFWMTGSGSKGAQAAGGIDDIDAIDEVDMNLEHSGSNGREAGALDPLSRRSSRSELSDPRASSPSSSTSSYKTSTSRDVPSPFSVRDTSSPGVTAQGSESLPRKSGSPVVQSETAASSLLGLGSGLMSNANKLEMMCGSLNSLSGASSEKATGADNQPSKVVDSCSAMRDVVSSNPFSLSSSGPSSNALSSSMGKEKSKSDVFQGSTPFSSAVSTSASDGKRPSVSLAFPFSFNSALSTTWSSATPAEDWPTNSFPSSIRPDEDVVTPIPSLSLPHPQDSKKEKTPLSSSSPFPTPAPIPLPSFSKQTWSNEAGWGMVNSDWSVAATKTELGGIDPWSKLKTKNSTDLRAFASKSLWSKETSVKEAWGGTEGAGSDAWPTDTADKKTDSAASPPKDNPDSGGSVERRSVGCMTAVGGQQMATFELSHQQLVSTFRDLQLMKQQLDKTRAEAAELRLQNETADRRVEDYKRELRKSIESMRSMDQELNRLKESEEREKNLLMELKALQEQNGLSTMESAGLLQKVQSLEEQVQAERSKTQAAEIQVLKEQEQNFCMTSESKRQEANFLRHQSLQTAKRWQEMNPSLPLPDSLRDSINYYQELMESISVKRNDIVAQLKERMDMLKSGRSLKDFPPVSVIFEHPKPPDSLKKIQSSLFPWRGTNKNGPARPMADPNQSPSPQPLAMPEPLAPHASLAQEVAPSGPPLRPKGPAGLGMPRPLTPIMTPHAEGPARSQQASGAPPPSQPQPSSTPSLPPPLRPLHTGKGLMDARAGSPGRTVTPPLRAPESAVAGAAAAAGTGAKLSSFDRLVLVLQRSFPSCSREDFHRSVRELRCAHNGTLTGLDLEYLVKHVTQMLISRGFKPVGPLNPIYNNGNSSNNNSNNSNLYGGNGDCRPPPGISATWCVDQLGATRSVSFEEDEPCAICHEDLNNAPKQILECAHQFHDQCIRTWFKHSSTCPKCRTHTLLLDEFPALK